MTGTGTLTIEAFLLSHDVKIPPICIFAIILDNIKKGKTTGNSNACSLYLRLAFVKYFDICRLAATTTAIRTGFDCLC